MSARNGQASSQWEGGPGLLSPMVNARRSRGSTDDLVVARKSPRPKCYRFGVRSVFTRQSICRLQIDNKQRHCRVSSLQKG